jgi:glucose/arabinose dehydrogenase
MTRTGSRRGLLELVAGGFSFPTSVAFDDAGTAYVAESGLPFGGAEPGGRIWHLKGDGRSLLGHGLRAPVNGLAYSDGALYVSEGGHPARISRLTLDGDLEAILEGLPGPGNYHTNMAAFGPDGKLYFSQGAMTNTGIVGLDAYELGWLRRLPHAHDLPGHDVVLTGVGIETEDPIRGGRTSTGAFSPFGTSPRSGQSVRAQLPCTAAVMRCAPDGRELELVAWGLRNAYGLGFLPDGRLLATDQGADDRGSRPVGDAPDLLYEVRRGAWYGWPDFIGGDAVTEPRYHPARGDAPSFLLANHHELPPPETPMLRFPAHSAAVKFDVGADGQLYIALFGDETPMTAPKRVRSRRLVARVDPADWSLHPIDTAPLERPIDVRADPRGELHVLDFGGFEMRAGGMVSAKAGTGALWRLRL